MKRRQFLRIGLGTLAAFAPLSFNLAREPSKPAHIGWLSAGDLKSNGPYVEAFRQGMSELGYVEGKSYVIDFRWGADTIKSFTWMAHDMVRENPDVIVATCAYTSGAALKVTSEVPIVLAAASDPVGLGMAETLPRPGGNVTGLMTLSQEITAKRLELLKEAVPAATRIGVFHDPGDETSRLALAEAQGAAKTLGVELVVFEASTDGEYSKIFDRIGAANVNATLVLPSQKLLSLDRRKLGAAALHSGLPSSFPYYEFVEEGGMMSFGVDFRVLFRRSATYVDKILRGTKPGELPIEQPTRFELAVNQKTARALGVAIPQSVLVRADRIIE